MDFVSAVAIAKAIRFLGLCIVRAAYIKSYGQASTILAKTEAEAE